MTGTRLRELIGAGDRIGLLVLPFLVVGVAANIAFPWLFSVGGPPAALRAISIGVLIPGLIVWGWSVVLILVDVPRGRLITAGPFAVVKHPLYTGVAFLVLPWVGFLFNSWLGVVLGAMLYLGSRLFAPTEEAQLARAFGPAWDAYVQRVRLPWL